MRNFLGLAIIILLGVYYQTAASSEVVKPENDRYFNSICIAKDRLVSICTLEAYDGCICYNNGTCTKQWVNWCIDCGKRDVFAVLSGSCPDVHPYLCSPQTPLITEKSIQRGCVCTMDGKCEVKDYDQSKKCQSSNDLAYFPGLACPAENLKETKVVVYKTVVCTPSLRYSKVACPKVIKDWGCVTYSDGTKRTVPINACTCQQPTVLHYAVNHPCY